MLNKFIAFGSDCDPLQFCCCCCNMQFKISFVRFILCFVQVRDLIEAMQFELIFDVFNRYNVILHIVILTSGSKTRWIAVKTSTLHRPNKRIYKSSGLKLGLQWPWEQGRITCWYWHTITQCQRMCKTST